MMADQAAQLGVRFRSTSLLVRPAGLGGVDGVEDLTADGVAVAVEDRYQPMTSVQPDQLQEQLSKTTVLVDTLEQRLPELEALSACVRAQLEPMLEMQIREKPADSQREKTAPIDPAIAERSKE